MRKGLREITQRFALRPGLFCVEPEMIGIAQHSFEQQPGLIEFFGMRLACACQRFYQPEGTHVKRAFFPRKTVNVVLRRIAINKIVADEAAVPRVLKDGIYAC